VVFRVNSFSHGPYPSIKIDQNRSKIRPQMVDYKLPALQGPCVLQCPSTTRQLPVHRLDEILIGFGLFDLIQ
jgi:hypothetical protein